MWVVNAAQVPEGVVLLQLDCLGWVNCSRLVSLVSKRFQEAEPVGGELGCSFQKRLETAWPPKFSKFMFGDWKL